MSENESPIAGAESVAAPAPVQANDQDATATPESEEQRPKGVQKRIDELTRNWRQVERDRDHWRELAMRSAQQPAPQTPAPVEAPVGKPTLEAFGFDQEKYFDALADWKIEQREATEREKQQKQESQKQQMATATTLQKHIQAASQKYEDFAEVVGNPALPLPMHVVEAAVDLGETAGDVLYYLGQNPDKAAEIAQMPERRAAMALARIEAQFTAKPSPPIPAAPQVSKAPPPPAAVGSRAPVSVDPMKLSADEWRNHRNKELAERARSLRRKP